MIFNEGRVARQNQVQTDRDVLERNMANRLAPLVVQTFARFSLERSMCTRNDRSLNMFAGLYGDGPVN